MDWVTLRSRGKELVRKYRYVLLVVLAGLFLMALPDGKNTKAAPEPAAAETETTASAADKSFSAWMSRFFFFRRNGTPAGSANRAGRNSQPDTGRGQGAGASDPAGRGADGIPDGRGFRILRRPVGHCFDKWV